MPLRTHLDEQPSLNLTSMIDVLFLLIIFFMVGHEVHGDGAEDRPEGAASQRRRSADRRAGEEGRQRLSRRPDHARSRNRHARRTEPTARARPASNMPTSACWCAATARGEFQHVAEVLNACRKAGITELGVAVTTEKPPSAQRR